MVETGERKLQLTFETYTLMSSVSYEQEHSGSNMMCRKQVGGDVLLDQKPNSLLE